MKLHLSILFFGMFAVALHTSCEKKQGTQVDVISTTPSSQVEVKGSSVVTREPPPPAPAGSVIVVEPQPAPQPPTTTTIIEREPLAPTTTVIERAPTTTTTTTVAPMTTAVVPAEAPAPPIPQPPTAVEAGTVSTNEKVGIMECDDFATKYTSCISEKIPIEERPARISTLDQSIRKWQAMAKTPQGKTDAANECMQTRDLTRQATVSFGCEWDTKR